MTIRYTCTGCGSVLKIKDEKAGTEGHCPKCKAAFRVPDLAPADESLDAPSAMVSSPADPEADSSHPETTTESEPIQKVDVEDAAPILRMDDDDFDSPPILSMSDDDLDPPVVPPTPAPPVPKAETSKPAKKKSRAKDDDFDPAEFLSEGGSSPKWTPSTSNQPSDFGLSGFSMDEESTAPVREPMKPSKPTPSPGSTAAAAAAAWDSKMAAKQMQKAIKESRSEAIAAKEDAEKGERFDWAGFFREFGLKGLAGLAGIVLLAYGVYFMSARFIVGGIKLPPLGYVTGTVTLDGTPLSGATVYFAPTTSANDDSKKSSNLRPRTSIGVTDDKGYYRMVYLDKTEGVAVGQCRIWISKMSDKGRQLVTGEFNEMNLTMREVKSGSQKIDFAMTSPPGRK